MALLIRFIWNCEQSDAIADDIGWRDRAQFTGDALERSHPGLLFRTMPFYCDSPQNVQYEQDCVGCEKALDTPFP